MIKKPDQRLFSTVIDAYLDSPKFLELAATTQDGYRRFLLKAQTALGFLSVDVIRPSLVQIFLDEFSAQPGIQTNTRVALKAVERWAVVRDLLPFPIMTGTEATKPKGGHKPWTEAQIECAENHARRDIANAIVLAANTGQRGSDLVKMRWTDVMKHDGHPGINVIQRKTGLHLWIPMTQHLQAAMATWERRPGPILLSKGTPWNRAQLTLAWTYERNTNPKLEPCAGMVLHGLRASACVRLRRAGASESQISDMVGLSVPMVARYCRLSEQKDNAMAAVHYLDGTNRERTKLKKDGKLV
jgi:integrase